MLLALAMLVPASSGLTAAPPQQRAPRGVIGQPEAPPPSGEPAPRPLFGRPVLAPFSGEPVNGFPSWQERVLHEWINRARVDPQADLAGCPAGYCQENVNGCYTPQNPAIWNQNAGRSSRFHAAEMGLRNFFGQDSNCTLVGNISALYPGTCSGVASCACVGGTSSCNPSCTTSSARMTLFGASTSGWTGELLAAGYEDVDSAFYAWLWEPTANTSACTYTKPNGHRWILLSVAYGLGTGYASVPGSEYVDYFVGGFGGPNGPIPKIPSGAHYPQQGSSIAFWANWYDTAAPLRAAVNVDGTCHAMTLGRGSPTNGAYTATVTGLGSGCHRYAFEFLDSNGVAVGFPSTGSYGIGTTACPDWDASWPASCTPFSVTAVSPNFGLISGGTVVSITGADFVPGATVAFGGTAAISVNVVNPSLITAVSGAHAAGTVDVVVTNPGPRVATLANSFTYLDPPVTGGPPVAGDFHTLPPCRLVDTRSAVGVFGGPALAASSTRLFPVTLGGCGVPPDAAAVSVNLTVTGPAAAGYLTVYPARLAAAPLASSVNFKAGDTRANNAVLPLGSDGSGALKVLNGSTGSVQFIVDVTGYFR